MRIFLLPTFVAATLPWASSFFAGPMLTGCASGSRNALDKPDAGPPSGPSSRLSLDADLPRIDGGPIKLPADGGPGIRLVDATPLDAAPLDAAPSDDGGPMAGSDGGLVGPPDAHADAFVPPADSGPPCDDSPCRLVGPQCGCLGGLACYANGDGLRGCGPAGNTAVGQPCNVIADCEPGSTCLDLGGGRSACHRYCEGDAMCEGAGACTINLPDSTGAPTGDALCTLDCEPVTQTGCPVGSWCFVGAAGERDLTDCVGNRPGTRSQGLPCITSSDCAPGHLCFEPSAGAGRRCLHYCRGPGAAPAPSPDCGTFEDCFPLDPRFRLGRTEYGLCWNRL